MKLKLNGGLNRDHREQRFASRASTRKFYSVPFARDTTLTTRRQIRPTSAMPESIHPLARGCGESSTRPVTPLPASSHPVALDARGNAWSKEKTTCRTLQSASALEFARRVAGYDITIHARPADIYALAEVPRVVTWMTLGDARTLLLGVFGLVRTRSENDCKHCQKTHPPHRGLLTSPKFFLPLGPGQPPTLFHPLLTFKEPYQPHHIVL